MQLFLIIAGSVFLGILLALYVAVWWIKRWFRKLVEPLSDLAGAFDDLDAARITLAPATQPPSHPTPFDAAIRGFQQAGFTSVGRFRCEEISDLLIHALVRDTDACCTVVYDKPKPGVWLDVVSVCDDGRIITHTTLKETGLDRPEFQITARVPDASPAALLAAHLHERPAGPCRPCTPATFVPLFQESYARVMDWRLVRGITEDEVRRNMQLEGKEITDSEVRSCVAMANAKHQVQLESLLRKQFLAESRIPAAEWQAVENRIIIVRDNSTPDSLFHFLAGSFAGLDDHAATRAAADAKARLADGPIRDAFHAVVQQFHGDRAFQHLGTVRGLVTADLWVHPEYPDSEDSTSDD